ncbi:MAG: hypothetical protein JSW61_02370 [Candidatus Thorarchaeota archaeon]|nr:MAG: hypothetical protein JSW61_02370 [Candidatus Thorarchaeota archaeon]
MQGIVELVFQLGFAFGSGLYVALSPCLFPLLPLFLLRTLQSESSRSRSLLITVALVLGILTSLALFVFVLRFIIGTFFLTHFIQIQAALGVLIVVLGILTMSESLRMRLGLSRLGLSSSPQAPTGILSVYILGLGYSLIAAPCAGPAILAIVSLLIIEVEVIVVVILFLAVSVGAAIPYLAIALVTGEARTKLAMSMSEKTRKIELVVGAIVAIVGVVLILPLLGISLLF